MDGNSQNIATEKLEKLRALLPEAFTEGQIDWDKLRLALGEDINIKGERYVLNWAGKSDAFRAIQTPTTATLAPDRDESVNFDQTQNIFIEGENLEVLKVLQKSYYGKIKMIYIDPPYNTGNDSFVYPDKFAESREEYLQRIQATDSEGRLVGEGLFQKNSQDNGHYHSNWLSMMYPRLYLARNMLREDGVIFVSIDDNEVHNLRLLMNEIFGEENFMATIVWQKKYATANDATGFASMHDYILAFQKTSSFKRLLLPRTEKQDAYYKYDDQDGRGQYRLSDLSVKTYSKSYDYQITNPQNGATFSPPKGRCWFTNKDKMEQLIKDARLYFGDDGKSVPQLKRYLNDVQQGLVPSTWWPHQDGGHNDEARKEIKSLFPENPPFDTPKPSRLIQRLIKISSDNDDDIVLDFFAGSATTAHSTFSQNVEDGKMRKFILVQMPEPLENKDYPSIAAVAKDRIRRVIQRIKEENPLFADETLGFRAFRLQPSNFKLWRSDGLANQAQLEQQMELLANIALPATHEEDILYELLLKSGLPLTASLETHAVGDGHWFLAGGQLALALSTLTPELVQNILDHHPQAVIVLDSLFNGDDALKTNTQLQFTDAGINFQSI